MKPLSGLTYDPAIAVAHLASVDLKMAALIQRLGPFALKLQPAKSLFEALLRSIIYQQLHGKAAAKIHERVSGLLTQSGGLTPKSLGMTPDESLRAAGLSGNKLLALRDLAAKCAEGTVPTLQEAHQLSDDELLLRLTQIRGIGPWTVQMLLLFTLSRPDVMPAGDFAIRLAFQQLYRKRKSPPPALILKHSRLWQPYRSVASWYLWRSLD